MKLLLFVAVTVVVHTTLSRAQLPVNITGIDLDKILNNERLLQSYLRCFLDQGPCTAQGREGKKIFPVIYESNCAVCNDTEKKFIKKYVKQFLSKRMNDWEKIVQKYDPEHKKEKDFLAWINEP